MSDEGKSGAGEPMGVDDVSSSYMSASSSSSSSSSSAAGGAKAPATGGDENSAGAGNIQLPRFEIKKWNAVAMWSWDICADTCAICRNSLNEPSIEYQVDKSLIPNISSVDIKTFSFLIEKI